MVREIARLQGFPNDFVFYDSDPYAQVVAALPPPIAMRIGQAILRTIYEYRLVCGDTDAIATEASVPSTKRPETEEARTRQALEDALRPKRARVEVVSPPSMPSAQGKQYDQESHQLP